MFQKDAKRPVGLDIGSASVKLVELSGCPGAFTLENLAVAIVENHGDDEDCARSLESVKDACGLEARRAATSVSGGHVAVRSFHFPKLEPKEVRGAVWYEGSQVIAFDLKDAYVDYSIIDTGDKGSGTDVLLAAALKGEVDRKTTLMRSMGFEPRVVGIDALVLLEALMNEIAPERTVAVVDVGANVTSIGISRRGTNPFMRDIEIAGDACTRAVGERLGVDHREAEKAKVTEAGTNPAVLDALDGVTRRLVGEIARSIAYFRSRNKGPEVDAIFLCGGGAELPGFSDRLAAATDIRVQLWSPLSSVKVDEERFDRATVEKLAPFVALASALAMSEDVH